MTAAVWFGWFAWFLAAAAPSLGGEDSGEFATAAVTLGISHAPGYPLYALVGRLICVLPVGNPAFRLNLMSAGCAALACTIAFACVHGEALRRFRHRPGVAVCAGLVAALVIGMAPALRGQAAISDKYAVHLALFSVVVLAAWRGGRAPALAFLTGLAFAHHLQTLYLVPALAWLGWRRGINIPRVRTALCAAVLALIGVSPKLVYPPIRAAQRPVLQLADPVTPVRALAYLTARTYGARVRGPGAATRWRDVVARLGHETGWAGLATGVVGLVLLARGAPPGLGGLPWLTLATGLGLAASLEITGREFYLLPVAWLLALGTGWLAGSGRAGILALAVPAWLAVTGVPPLARSWLTVEEDEVRDLLASLPPRALLLASGDDLLYPLFYLQGVAEIRTDVVVVPEGFLTFPAARRRLAARLPEAGALLEGAAALRTEDDTSREVALLALAAGRAVALTNPSRTRVAAGLTSAIRDAVFELHRGTPRFRTRDGRWLRARGWAAPAGVLTERGQRVIMLAGKYQRQFADALANAGETGAALPRYRRALSNPFLEDREGTLNNCALALERAGDRAGAAGLYDRLAALGTRRPEIWLNAGNLRRALGRPAEAAACYRRALELAAPGSGYAAYARRQLAGRDGL